MAKGPTNSFGVAGLLAGFVSNLASAGRRTERDKQFLYSLNEIYSSEASISIKDRLAETLLRSKQFGNKQILDKKLKEFADRAEREERTRRIRKMLAEELRLRTSLRSSQQVQLKNLLTRTIDQERIRAKSTFFGFLLISILIFLIFLPFSWRFVALTQSISILIGALYYFYADGRFRADRIPSTPDEANRIIAAAMAAYRASL